MSSRTWLNLILLAITCVLALIVYFKPGKSPEVHQRLISDYDPAGITLITIERELKPEIRLQQRDGSWRLVTPMEVLANQSRVDALRNLPAKKSFADYPVTDLELHRYGLAPALATVLLNEYPIKIGSLNPVNQRRYLLIDDTVHLISDDLFDVYTATPASYAATKVIPPDYRISQLTLPDVTLLQNAPGRWEVQSVSDDPNIENPESIIDAWHNAKALWVDPYNNAESIAEILLRFDNEQSQRLIVTATQPQLVLVKPTLKIQYHLPSSDTVALIPTLKVAE